MPSDTEKSQKRSGGFSYSTKLAVTFALIAFMAVFISGMILSVVWNTQFNNYTFSNLSRTASQLADKLSNSYAVEERLSQQAIATITADSSYAELGIRVNDALGNTIYDSSWELSDEGVVLVETVPTDKVATAAIMVDNKPVGTVNVWVLDSENYLTERDVELRDNMYQSILLAAIVAVVLAAAIGLLFSNRLIDPLKKITRTAKAIKEGDLTARTEMKGEDEILSLGQTFDEMADSIQRDRELERRLTTDVAHELRTPLMGIQATTEAIMDGIYPADEERLGAINSETLRLKRLVEALMNLSKLESGSVPFNPAVTDLAELMSGLAVSHEALFEAAELTLKYERDDDPVVVYGDPDMLRQAVANLVSNAVRYNEPGGSVTVGVHKRDDMAAISVADTGIGISPEDQAMVFSRFWRADAGRNRASGGLGVGLSVVKELVDYNSGTIELESEVGKGTTFTILLPLYEDDSALSEKDRKKKQKAAKQKSSKQKNAKTGKQNKKKAK